MQQWQGQCRFLIRQTRVGLLTQIVSQSGVEVALSVSRQLPGNKCSLRPVSTAFVIGQQGESCLLFKRCAFKFEQGSLGAIEQAGFQKVQSQRMLGALMIGLVQVAT